MQLNVSFQNGGVVISRTAAANINSGLSQAAVRTDRAARDAGWFPDFWIGASGHFALAIPFWLPAAVPWAFIAARRLLVGRTRTSGRCVFCGYDLRPLPPVQRVKCSECGRTNLRRLKRGPNSKTEAP